MTAEGLLSQPIQGSFNHYGKGESLGEKADHLVNKLQLFELKKPL